jgi:anti-sigma B factor antagonist
VREVSVSFNLNIRNANGVTVVDLSGRITLGEGASALRDTLRELAGGGRKDILLNLAEVTFVDSSGIGVLVSSFATLTNAGGQLKLLHLTKRVKDLLVITKLYTVFDVYDDEPAAIRSFRGSPAGAPAAGV